MKNQLRLGLLLLASTCTAETAAAAEQTPKPAAASRFERADADRSGEVSLSEFAAANDLYLGSADADGDGRMTQAEIADQIMRRRAERAAQRIVKRLDTDGDGVLSRAEVEARQKARFTRLDKNGDGKLSAEEMPEPKARRPKG